MEQILLMVKLYLYINRSKVQTNYFIFYTIVLYVIVTFNVLINNILPLSNLIKYLLKYV